jgi:hypothetical protein
MEHNPSSVSRSRSRRRWIGPAAAAGAGGTALVVWLEELMILVAELIGVILLPILAGIIFLFNHLVFKTAMPRKLDRRDVKNTSGERTNGTS